jgi:hypothetical protein
LDEILRKREREV